ncbi:MAG TPA: hypothetical protein VF858_13845, partial [Gemmatimonadaceae bacterium]
FADWGASGADDYWSARFIGHLESTDVEVICHLKFNDPQKASAAKNTVAMFAGPWVTITILLTLCVDSPNCFGRRGAT